MLNLRKVVTPTFHHTKISSPLSMTSTMATRILSVISVKSQNSFNGTKASYLTNTTSLIKTTNLFDQNSYINEQTDVLSTSSTYEGLFPLEFIIIVISLLLVILMTLLHLLIQYSERSYLSDDDDVSPNNDQLFIKSKLFFSTIEIDYSFNSL